MEQQAPYNVTYLNTEPSHGPYTLETRPADWNYNWASPLDPRAPQWHQTALFLRVTGHSKKDICRQLRRSHSALAHVLSHPPYRDYLEQQAQAVYRSHYDAALKLQVAHSTVADELIRLATSADKEDVRLRAIALFANRFGLGQVSRLNEGGSDDGDDDDEGLGDAEARLLAIDASVDDISGEYDE